MSPDELPAQDEVLLGQILHNYEESLQLEGGDVQRYGRHESVCSDRFPVNSDQFSMLSLQLNIREAEIVPRGDAHDRSSGASVHQPLQH